MGTALKYLRELLERIGLELDYKTATSLLVLLFLLILLPVGIFLIKNQNNFMPKAAGELIVLGDGGCIKLNKDKKKVVDCPTVPVRLNNPFFGGSPMPSSSTSASANPSPSQGSSASPSPTSSGTTVACATSVTNGQELLTAMNCYKKSGATAKITLPAGTIEVSEKISVPGNLTIAGAGINTSVIKMAANFTGDDALMANDSTNGQQNIVLRDFTLQGDSRRTGNSCCYGLKLQNIADSFVVNVAVKDFGIDGIYLGNRPNKAGAVRVRLTGCVVSGNGRNGITLADGSDNVIDHCQLSGNSTNELVSAIDLEPDRGNAVSNTHIFENSITNNRNNGISITQNPNDPGGLVMNNFVCNNTYGGNGGTDFDDKGFQTSTSGCTAGNLNPPTASIPSYFARLINSLVKNVSAQDSDDTFVDGEDNDSSDQFVTGSATPSGSLNPSPTASVTSGTLQYRLAESEASLAQAQWKQFAFVGNEKSVFEKLAGEFDVPTVKAQDSDDTFVDGEDNDSSDQFVNASATPSGSLNPGASSSSSVGGQFINTTFVLKDSKPGVKQIWVEFKHPNGTTRIGNVTFDLVDKTPQILGLACNLDVSKQSLKITVTGNYFGNEYGTVSTVSPDNKLEILGWSNNQVAGMLKSPNIPVNQGQKFKVKVVRADGFESGTAVCAVDKSLVSLGAKLFCREPGKFDATDVAVTILYNKDDNGSNSAPSKVEEKVTISKDGEIDNLKTQLQVGKNYAVSIKAPSSLRRTAVFTAMEGTTEILRPDGAPFILPIGDIAPKINVDGQINTLDRAELIRQWKVLGQGDGKLTGDFNRDTRVNSIDWACMQYDFGSSDEPLPVEVPGAASNTIHIGSSSDTLFIPVSSPTPAPSVIPSPSVSVSPSPSPLVSPSPSATPVSMILQSSKILLIS